MTDEGLTEALRGSVVFRDLPDDVLDRLVRAATIRTRAAGEVLFDRGDPGDALVLVRSGSVEIRRSVELATVLQRVGPGHFFGELAAFDPAPRAAAAVAVEDTVTVEFARADLEALFAADPATAMAMVGVMAREATRAREQAAYVTQFLDRRVRERTAEVRETQLEVMRRLGRAAELRDDHTGEHIQRMSGYAELLALAAGFDDERAEQLQAAAPMHDVGKIGIPDHVLLKPGPLDEQEWAIMRSHTVIGAQMLSGSSSPIIRLAAQIARQHHERWDGSGYPDGLTGEQIALEARICTVADVFDALTSQRPYKAAWPFDAALEEVVGCAGSMFDPVLAELFAGLEHDLRAIHDSAKADLDA